MDHFGIGAAVYGAARVFFRTARGTGRSTSLLESLKHGDRVIFKDSKEAERFRRLASERDLDISCIPISPSSPHKIFDYPPSEGRTLFDHSWLEDFYLSKIEGCESEIDRLQRESSGYGEAHQKTRIAAAEISKWHR
ncbi:MAG: hypothetical protein ACRBBW_03975 [Cellvibrionaceae bacterium]